MPNFSSTSRASLLTDILLSSRATSNVRSASRIPDSPNSRIPPMCRFSQSPYLAMNCTPYNVLYTHILKRKTNFTYDIDLHIRYFLRSLSLKAQAPKFLVGFFTIA